MILKSELTNVSFNNKPPVSFVFHRYYFSFKVLSKFNRLTPILGKTGFIGVNYSIFAQPKNTYYA